jgi:hypothetical protein
LGARNSSWGLCARRYMGVQIGARGEVHLDFIIQR